MASKISYAVAKAWLAGLRPIQRSQVEDQLKVMAQVGERRGALLYLMEQWTRQCVCCERLITEEEFRSLGLCYPHRTRLLTDGSINIGSCDWKITRPTS